MTTSFEITRTQRQSGYGRQESLTEIKTTLVGVEEELHKLLRLYEECTSLPDVRD